MKTLRFTLPAVLLLLSTVAFTQAPAPKSEAPKTAPPKTEAQKSFDVMKSLAGEWEGAIDTDMPQAMKEKMGAVKLNPMHLSMRVTSRGNVLVHEFQEAGTPLDATKYDHPVTMLFLEGDQLQLIHYCDAGNRPRMTGKMSPDGKTVEFEFVEVTGKNLHQHMHHAVFTIIDADHHTEDWTFMMGENPIRARFNLHRKPSAAPALW
jgi:hypothetical protein